MGVEQLEAANCQQRVRLTRAKAESFVTSGGFSILESFSRSQADERVVGAGIDEEEEGILRILPLDVLFGHEAMPKQRTKFYLSLSAESLLKDCFEQNSPTHLDPSYPTTSFSANQMIQFARAVRLEVSLASFSLLEDLMLKARGGSGVYPVTSRYPAGKSLFRDHQCCVIINGR